MLLEPVAIHPLPFHLHDVDDRVEPAFSSEVCFFLLRVLCQSVSIVEEDRLPILPEAGNDLFSCLWTSSAEASLITIVDSRKKARDRFNAVGRKLLL